MMGKNGIDIIYFGDQWDPFWRRRQQIAMRLSQKPWVERLLYIEQPLTLTSWIKAKFGSRDFEATLRWNRGNPPLTRVAERVWLLTPKTVLPLTRSMTLNRLEQRRRAIRLKQSVTDWQGEKQQQERPVLWVSLPHVPISTIRDIPRSLLWYDCTEDFSTFQDTPKAIRNLLGENDSYLTKESDIVSVVTQAQWTKKTPVNPRAYQIPNAVDVSLFEDAVSQEPPNQMEGISPPIVGFVGNLNVHQNWHVIEYFAERNPNWSMVFIGPNQSDHKILASLARFPNIHVLDPVPYDQLPRHIHSMNIGVQFYVQGHLPSNEATQKIYLYLAAGKPVVSYAPGEANDSQNLVRIANSTEEFEQLVKQAVKNDGPEHIQRRKEHARMNSWDARVDQISDILINHISAPLQEKP